MRDKTYISRFSDAPWVLKDEERPLLTVGGAGGICSWLLLFLSRTDNYRYIMLYEFDDIDSTNMAGQFFKPSQIGGTKSMAIQSNMREFSDAVRMDSFGKFEKGAIVTPITISGFDNMKARRELFEEWKKLENRELFIDGRMIMEDGQIYAVTKGKEDRYEETLFSDDEVKDAACSMKATTHCGAHTASIMVAILNNYLANKYFYKDYIREVPFSYVFSFVPLTVDIDV